MLNQMVFFGDSLTAGFQLLGQSIGQGGGGGWLELAVERLARTANLGPLISSGIRPVSGGWVSSAEWSFTGTWTAVTGTDAFDKMPYGASGCVKYANGISNVATFTVPTQWRQPVGYAFYYVDYTGGGDWQYRINGGTWTNMNQTLVQDNKLAKFYVASNATKPVTIDIRGYNGTSDCGVLPTGIEVYYTDPTVNNLQGLIVHNVSVGGRLLGQMDATAPADHYAFVDSVKLGTGNPLPTSPNRGVFVMHINDVAFGVSATTWGTRLTNFYNRVGPLGPVGFLSPYETGTSTTGAANQAAYRDKTKEIAGIVGANVLDFYDLLTQIGYGNGTGDTSQAQECEDAGFLSPDDSRTHELQPLHQFMAKKTYEWLITAKSPSFLRDYVGISQNNFKMGNSVLGGSETMAGTASPKTAGAGGIPIASGTSDFS